MKPSEVQAKIKDAETKVQQALDEYRAKMNELVDRAEKEKIERLRSELKQ